MIKYAYYDFKFGILKIGYTDTKIVYLKRCKKIEGENEKSALSDEVFEQVIQYLDGKRTSFDFDYELYGTEFQKKVWESLCRIPYGETRTYKQVAEDVGSPKACRAVGLANNRNPVTIVIPCHRVIGSDGSLTGYAGGIEMKQALLEIEQKDLVHITK